MSKEISIEKIIGDINKTKGDRKYCYNLPTHLSDYASSIVGWLKATSPVRIDALVAEVEKLRAERDASLNAERVWEKTMMEVCGEDGPASVASEIRALKALRDTAMQALKSQVEQLAAENVALKSFGDTLFGMYKGLEISGGGIHDEQSVVCQQAALDAAMSAFEEIETPATNAAIAGIKADGVEEFAAYQRSLSSGWASDKGPFSCLKIAEDAEGFAKRLREGAK